MSDHFSGPRAVADPTADITDVFAFPSPDSPEHLVLAMDVFGKAGPSALFSGFDCVFEVPPEGGAQPAQQGRCLMQNGKVIPFRVNDEKGGRGEGVHVFAGQRSDPFFLDVRMIEKTVATGKLAFKEVGSDTLYGTNVLAIVLKVEWTTLPKGGPLFAVVCETLRSGKRPVRIERVGRPEIKNVSLSWKMFDRVNRDLEIRDLYNNEDAFKLAPDYIGAYRARMNANLAFYDGLDGKIDWPFNEHGNHPLTDLLLADFLVVDASKPFREISYFEIEQAILKGRTHATAGGRWLNEDMMDFIFTLYVNAGNGPRIEDGIDGPITWSSKFFPYMAPPNPLKVFS